MSADLAAAKLETIVGAENVVGPSHDNQFSLGGCSPAIGTAFPDSVEQVQEIIRLCSQHHLTAAAIGNGTRAWQCSRPSALDILISTRRLNSVTDYEPDDLVLAVQAGMSGSEVRSLLGSHSQVLTLDPPGFARSTMGAIASTRSAGPARAQFGTPKDLLIGATIVDAEGELVKAGGKVMKHVAGYDLCKLYAGSLGTLGIFVETVWRLSPRPVKSAAGIALFADAAAAEPLAARVSDSYLQPRSLELLNRKAAEALGIDWPEAAKVAMVAVFDGGATQTDFQVKTFDSYAAERGAISTSSAECGWGGSFHDALADAGTLGAARLWEVHALPSNVPAVFEAAMKHSSVAVAGSAHSGVIRIADSEMDEHSAEELSKSLLELGRVSAFSAGGASFDKVWLSPPSGLPIMKQIRTKLDPEGVLASGRFVGGI